MVTHSQAQEDWLCNDCDAKYYSRHAFRRRAHFNRKSGFELHYTPRQRFSGEVYVTLRASQVPQTRSRSNSISFSSRFVTLQTEGSESLRYDMVKLQVNATFCKLSVCCQLRTTIALSCCWSFRFVWETSFSLAKIIQVRLEKMDRYYSFYIDLCFDV